MKRISDFLDRFIKVAQSGEETKIAIVSILAQVGVKVKNHEDILVQGTIATLKLSPPQKSEVFLKQKKILALLAKNPLTKKITTVR